MCPHWSLLTTAHTEMIFVIRSFIIHTAQCTVHVQIFEECKFVDIRKLCV